MIVCSSVNRMLYGSGGCCKVKKQERSPIAGKNLEWLKKTEKHEHIQTVSFDTIEDGPVRVSIRLMSGTQLAKKKLFLWLLDNKCGNSPLISGGVQLNEINFISHLTVAS